MKKKKQRKSRTGFVIVNEYGNFDTAVKEFTESISYEFLDWRKRQYFVPKPTHHARKLEGNKQESFKARLRNKEKEV